MSTPAHLLHLEPSGDHDKEQPLQTPLHPPGPSACRSLRGAVTLHPFSPADYVGRRYTRLNDDYAPLHGLCRFFLEHTGPVLRAGAHQMLPFRVDTAQLFEQFVAAWLARHLPPDLRVRAQKRYDLSTGSYFDIDLVLYDVHADGGLGPARAVLDTKYKAPDRPATSDSA